MGCMASSPRCQACRWARFAVRCQRLSRACCRRSAIASSASPTAGATGVPSESARRFRPAHA
eukprot:803788-Lingulodinium_polyedra.AAC.1